MSAQPCTCDEVIPLLDAYHDGELSGAEESLVSSHLVSCAKCPGRLKEIESLVGSLQGMPKLAMPRDLSTDVDFLKKALESDLTTASSEGEGVVAQPAATEEAPPKPISRITASDIADFSSNKPLLPRSNAKGPLAIAFLSAAAAITLAITIPPMLKNQKANPTSVAQQPSPTEESRLSNAPEKSDSTPSVVEPEKFAAEPEPAKAAMTHVSIHPELALHERRDLIRNQVAHDGSLQAMLPADTTDERAATGEIASANSGTNANVDTQTTSEGNSDKSGTAPEIASANTPAIMPSDEHDTPSVTPNEQPEILAAYPTDTSSAPEELGLSTDEDGLYAFKM